ncbi:MAG: hypothetical protein C4542_02625 [Dehalococcoidia bacterium]|nr:MAG: hypothetical protein C4542_02625 [Dehalococcoidia bacterium]
MTRREKRLQELRNNPRNTSLNDFESVIKDFGAIEEGSKHPKAIIGEYTLPYKRENPIKACYVLQLLEIIDSL